MRKYYVLQTILGLLIVGTLVFWLVALLNGYSEREGTIQGTGMVVGVMSTPANAGSLFIWISIYFLTGLIASAVGVNGLILVRRKKPEHTMNAAKRITVTQLVLGIIAVGLMVWFTGWAELPYGSSVLVNEGREIIIRHSAGWETTLTVWRITSFLLGPVITVLAVLQLKRVNNIMNVSEHGMKNDPLDEGVVTG